MTAPTRLESASGLSAEWNDPVLPRALDGLRAQPEVNGSPLELVYRIAARGHGPTALTLVVELE